MVRIPIINTTADRRDGGVGSDTSASRHGTRRHAGARTVATAIVFIFDLMAMSTAALLSHGGGPVLVAFMGGVTLLLAVGRLYYPPPGATVLDVLPALATRIAIAIAALALAGLTVALHQHALVTALWMSGALVVGRVLSHAFVRLLRRTEALRETFILVGSGDVAKDIVTATKQRDMGLSPLGYVDDSPVSELDLEWLGSFSQLLEAVQTESVDRLIVAFSRHPSKQLVVNLRRVAEHHAPVYFVPRFFELATTADDGQGEELAGIPLQRMRTAGATHPLWRLKRVFDVVGATTLLILTAPVLAVLALAVKLTSPGPALFRQERISQHGRPFVLLKFRSMYVNDDSDVTWSVSADPRRTPLGRLMRVTHLDELPQLFNVLRGDMSLVGPRPERQFFIEQFTTIPGYDDRLRVPAGLTGWAQVNGLRGDTSISNRARLDNRYIERWSPWRDVVILVRTVRTMFEGE